MDSVLPFSSKTGISVDQLASPLAVRSTIAYRAISCSVTMPARSRGPLVGTGFTRLITHRYRKTTVCIDLACTSHPRSLAPLAGGAKPTRISTTASAGHGGWLDDAGKVGAGFPPRMGRLRSEGSILGLNRGGKRHGRQRLGSGTGAAR